MGARNQHKAGGAYEFHIHRAYIIYGDVNNESSEEFKFSEFGNATYFIHPKLDNFAKLYATKLISLLFRQTKYFLPNFCCFTVYGKFTIIVTNLNVGKSSFYVASFIVGGEDLKHNPAIV